MGGNVTFAPSTLGGTGTAVIQSTGSLAQAGTVDLGAATRTFTINDGTPAVDVSILAAIIGTRRTYQGRRRNAAALWRRYLHRRNNRDRRHADAFRRGGQTWHRQRNDAGASAGGSALQIQAGVSNAIANTATLSLSDGSSPGSGLSVGLAAALVANRRLRRPGRRNQRDGEHVAVQRRGPRPRHVRQLDQQRHV